MSFESTLKIIFEKAVDTYNEATYGELSNHLSSHVELFSPEVNLPNIKTPAVHCQGFEEVIGFWAEVNKQSENKITRFEYLKIGKTSMVRCYYDKMSLVFDTEIFFDNYAKVIKIIHHHVVDDKS